MLQCTTGARKRGPSAINVLGNSHSHLLTNGTAGSNPEMFPCCFHHDSESWWSRHLMLFQLDFGCIASKDTVVKEKPAWFWYLQTFIVWRNECDREQGEGGVDWAGWNQGQEHPVLGTLFPQLCSPPPVQSTMWIQHTQSCLPFTEVCLLPSFSCSLAYVNVLPIGVPMQASGNCIYEPGILMKYWGFIKTASCWGDQEMTWTIFP